MLEITGHNLDVTEALKNHIHEKFEIIKNHDQDIISTEFILEVENPNHNNKTFKAEANVNVRGKTINAQSSSEDMYKSIDGMIHKLDKQILKHYGKMEAKNHAKEVCHHQPTM